MEFLSWGRMRSDSERVSTPKHRYEVASLLSDLSMQTVVHGGGRSYSDIALPKVDGGVVVTGQMNHVISFNREDGFLEVEAGISLRDVQSLALSAGWGLSVIPGTAWATVGGCLANDIHGKNHTMRGAFSRSVVRFTIFRDGDLLSVDRSCADLWSATIGGLGATGLIVSVTIQLIRWGSNSVMFKQERFVGIDEFLKKSDACIASGDEHVVGWIDAFSRVPKGVIFSGNLCGDASGAMLSETGGRVIEPTYPLPTSRLINPWVARAFNKAYWATHPDRGGVISRWEKFFCPLDIISGWNRLYGGAGFSQFQCVIPKARAQEGLGEILAACRKSGEGSFLSVIKTFGDLPSEGYLSFPRSGITFAMDFANNETTAKLFDLLIALTMHHGGSIYPAKVCLKNRNDFERMFPEWDKWAKLWCKDGLGAGSAYLNRIMGV